MTELGSIIAETLQAPRGQDPSKLQVRVLDIAKRFPLPGLEEALDA